MTAIDWSRVQTNLGKLYAGTIDNIEGPMSWIGLVDYAAETVGNGADSITLRGRKLAEVAHEFGLNTVERVAGFLANTSHETGDYTALRENLYYKTAASIRATWPKRFKTDAAAQPYVRNPQALANFVYARPAEGNTQPGDGWRYRGGGDIQTTFRNNFRATGADLKLPLEEHPELIETPAVAVLAALSYWRRNNINRWYDAGQPKKARSVMNSGGPNMENPIGWPDVDRRYKRLVKVMTS